MANGSSPQDTVRLPLSVYVDNARLPFRRRGRDLLMSHMLAETTEELDRMARAVGLPPWSIQSPATYREHYDVTADMRERAIALGAVAVDSRFLVRLRRSKRAAV